MSKKSSIEKNNTCIDSKRRDQTSSKNETTKGEKNYENRSATDSEEKNDDKTPIRKSSISLYKNKKLQKKIEKIVKETQGNLNSNIDKQQTTNKGKVSTKKVTFSKTNFLNIINVESYKKYNAENTCEDPFEDIKKTDKNQQSNDHVNVNCTCFIF